MSVLEKFRIEVKYLRRARRATLRVKPGHLIKLSLPYGVRRSQIEEWVLSKADWILKKHEMLESFTQIPEIAFVEGAPIPFAGGRLVIKSSDLKSVEISDTNILIPARLINDEVKVRKAIFKWYQEQALIALNESVSNYCSHLGVRAKSIRLKNYRSRWGACSSKGELIFNWQIILFERQLFEYVVAHEVCHLIEMNHSSKFYSILNQLGFDKSEMHRQFKNLKNIF